MSAVPEHPDRFAAHGPIGVAPSGTYLQHADGTPFFYLADTAWNGPLLATESEWSEYLADRKAKGFTAVQFVLTAPWSAALHDANGEQAYHGNSLNPRFFDRMDRRVAAINAAGMLVVPVLAWAANFGASGKLNPGVSLSTSLLQRLLRDVVDRYTKRHMLWLLAGDGQYGGLLSAWRWKKIGRAVFSNRPHAPVALHPMGLTWPYRRFRNEPWLDVVGYQSSHSDAPKTLRWLLDGPPTREWRSLPKPFINLEPCYEGIRNWAGSGAFTNREVRRAMYASLLNAPTAGVTYGAHGVWSWEREPREPLNHVGCGIARPWGEALQFPGSRDVSHLAKLFNSVEWWKLRPGRATRLGKTDWSTVTSHASIPDGSLSIEHFPFSGSVTLTSNASYAEWFDPQTGKRQPVGLSQTATTPTGDDWILLIQGRATQS